MPDYPLNDSLEQTNETIFDVAQQAVNLAMAVLKHPSMPVTGPIADQALDVLLKYADWRNIHLPKYFKRKLMIKNYGEQEAQAIWVQEQPVNQWFTVEDIAGKDDRKLYKYLCGLEQSSRGDGAVLVSSMTGEQFMWERSK
jgi:hypothetical protein